jgi:hypothetical protein
MAEEPQVIADGPAAEDPTDDPWLAKVRASVDGDDV